MKILERRVMGNIKQYCQQLRNVTSL